MLERIHAILIKECLQTLRDPRMRALLILVPIVQSIIFGYAVTTDVKEISLGVMDIDNTPESRDFVSRFASSRYFRIQERVASENQIRGLLDRGKVKAVLQIDNGFGGNIQAGG